MYNVFLSCQYTLRYTTVITSGVLNIFNGFVINVVLQITILHISSFNTYNCT